ncbi:hypothetical protein BH23PLA1_BH23PLA1_40480 [soil metagenome]
MPTNRTLIALAVAAILPLWVLAQEPTAPPAGTEGAEPPTEAESLLDQAIIKLKQLETAQADLRQDVEMLGQQFAVVGRYEKAPGRRLRMELQVQGLPASSGNMKQVSDGKTLWDYFEILDQQYYSRLDLTQVFQKLDDPVFDELTRAVFMDQLGMSGPDSLLQGLRQAARFVQSPEVAELDGRAVHILRGEWKDMSVMGAPSGPAPGPMALLPAYIPRLVEVWVGQEDGWPYKVVLQGKKRPIIAQKQQFRIGHDGRPQGPALSTDDEPPSKFILTYSNVDLDPHFGPNAFDFRPPADVRVEDTTGDRIAQLEQFAQILSAQQTSEAAREDTLLDGAIRVPPLGPEPEPLGSPPRDTPPATVAPR